MFEHTTKPYPNLHKSIDHLLKPVGKFYFSNVYADSRVLDAVRNDPVLYGETTEFLPDAVMTCLLHNMKAYNLEV